MGKQRWHWYYVISGWRSAIPSHWDVVLVNVPCVLGLSPTNTGYSLLWEHTLSIAVSVFPLTHIHPTPVCDHYGSLPLPVPERSKIILNPPLSLSKQTKLGFLSHHASVHVCVHVQWPQNVGSLSPHLKTNDWYSVSTKVKMTKVHSKITQI